MQAAGNFWKAPDVGALAGFRLLSGFGEGQLVCNGWWSLFGSSHSDELHPLVWVRTSQGPPPLLFFYVIRSENCSCNPRKFLVHNLRHPFHLVSCAASSTSSTCRSFGMNVCSAAETLHQQQVRIYLLQEQRSEMPKSVASSSHSETPSAFLKNVCFLIPLPAFSSSASKFDTRN